MIASLAVALLSTLATARAVQDLPVTPARDGLFQRAVVIGASASAGFGLQAELGTPTTFADVLSATLTIPHDPIGSFATEMFFINPKHHGKTEIEGALKANPTVVIALDFLFISVAIDEPHPVGGQRFRRSLDHEPCGERCAGCVRYARGIARCSPRLGDELAASVDR